MVTLLTNNMAKGHWLLCELEGVCYVVTVAIPTQSHPVPTKTRLRHNSDIRHLTSGIKMTEFNIKERFFSLDFTNCSQWFLKRN